MSKYSHFVFNETFQLKHNNKKTNKMLNKTSINSMQVHSDD